MLHRSRRNRLRIVTGCLAAIALWLGAGCATIPPARAAINLARHTPPTTEDRTQFNLSVYDNVWDWVNSRYYDAHFNGVDWRAAGERHRAAAAAAKNDTELYAAINALLDELDDRHTRAQSAPQFARSFWQLNVGLGIRADDVHGTSDGRRRITEVFPKSPAANAGVRVGWLLLAVNGRRPADVLGTNRLSEGETVACDFLTETGEPRQLQITARQIVVPSYRIVREVDDGVFLLRFDRFDFASAHWLRDEVKAHAGAKGLIIDLRQNPGGNLFALGSVLGDVFPAPIDMGRLMHRGSEALWQHFILQRGGPHYVGKIAVLVSSNTASAAEVFAQLVQEHHRGEIVGQKSSGAVLTVVFWPLAGGGKLWLSVYDYHSPEGTRVEKRGVLPDIPVLLAGGSDDRDDPVVQAAVAAIKTEVRPPVANVAQTR